MNSDQIKGKWNQFKGKMQQKYGIAVDDDETFSEGKYNELVGRAQEKSGESKEKIKREIESW
ncbi:CsbD family protein [Constantimarinum furrinae]|uniref:CsbD family protein n=1 Tax=Constantimarinum furrinae TaxID=2562285 RepID=A0A7G8PXQ4_9FLAO|nr:CsbD family protein [Constantimarinum furrinae]QNJ99120.1 CsbD family protein [Constantimarinum furrinae]